MVEVTRPSLRKRIIDTANGTGVSVDNFLSTEYREGSRQVCEPSMSLHLLYLDGVEHALQRTYTNVLLTTVPLNFTVQPVALNSMKAGLTGEDSDWTTGHGNVL